MPLTYSVDQNDVEVTDKEKVQHLMKPILFGSTYLKPIKTPNFCSQSGILYDDAYVSEQANATLLCTMLC